MEHNFSSVWLSRHSFWCFCSSKIHLDLDEEKLSRHLQFPRLVFSVIHSDFYYVKLQPLI